jgi:hypothetical protein
LIVGFHGGKEIRDRGSGEDRSTEEMIIISTWRRFCEFVLCGNFVKGSSRETE